MFYQRRNQAPCQKPTQFAPLVWYPPCLCLPYFQHHSQKHALSLIAAVTPDCSVYYLIALYPYRFQKNTLAGDIEGARHWAKQFKLVLPGVTIDQLIRTTPFATEEAFEPYLEGLKMMGID